MKIKFKEEVEVDLRSLSPERVRILLEAAVTAPRLRNEVMVVTSANDSVHKTNSLHYEGAAFDLRFLGEREGAILRPELSGVGLLDAQRRAALLWGERLRARLGNAYDVVVEKDHIHVEEDRK